MITDLLPYVMSTTVNYNTISKNISTRLKPILQDIVLENQSAFILDRAIQDNVLTMHKMLHYLKSSGATKHSSIAIKTDISKAYDRLEWSFIRVVLGRLGVHWYLCKLDGRVCLHDVILFSTQQQGGWGCAPSERHSSRRPLIILHLHHLCRSLLESLQSSTWEWYITRYQNLEI